MLQIYLKRSIINKIRRLKDVDNFLALVHCITDNPLDHLEKTAFVHVDWLGNPI